MEFITIWTKNYSKEAKETYNIFHGDDESKWPDTEDEGRVTINMLQVSSFNEIVSECPFKGGTTVFMNSGDAYSFKISYDEFKSIIDGIHK